jgi:hypothetical protein
VRAVGEVTFHVATMKTDGSDRRDLASAGAVAWSGVLDPGSLTWSPDGTRIAFTHVGAGGHGSIRYVTTDASQGGLMVADGHSPSWRR